MYRKLQIQFWMMSTSKYTSCIFTQQLSGLYRIIMLVRFWANRTAQRQCAWLIFEKFWVWISVWFRV